MSHRGLHQRRLPGEVRPTGVSALSGMRPGVRPDSGSYPFGAPPCRIHRPSRSVMQAGRRRTARWVLEFEPWRARFVEPLMGWTASDDPFAQIHLEFPTLAAAVQYAERQGLDYVVIEPAPERRRPRGTGKA